MMDIKTDLGEPREVCCRTGRNHNYEYWKAGGLGILMQQEETAAYYSSADCEVRQKTTHFVYVFFFLI